MNDFRYWGPGAELMQASGRMDRLFDEFFGPGGAVTPQNGDSSGQVPTYRLQPTS